MEGSEFRLPPASFSFLVLSMRAQVEVHLGLLPFGEAENAEPNLPLARHTIDMMAVLAEKTKGNLTPKEQNFLQNALYELRMAYVEVTNAIARGPQSAPPSK